MFLQKKIFLGAGQESGGLQSEGVYKQQMLMQSNGTLNSTDGFDQQKSISITTMPKLNQNSGNLGNVQVSLTPKLA